MKLQESGENYLEAILVLEKQKEAVHSVDVGAYLGFSKPSVSRAMGILKHTGHIAMAQDGALTLTQTGREQALRIYERHQLLTDYLVALGVDRAVAVADACRIEHVISEESFAHIKAYASAHLPGLREGVRAGRDLEA
ncbi:MAG: metal-dependent transcriptional regulator [Clostridia bacterium]